MNIEDERKAFEAWADREIAKGYANNTLGDEAGAPLWQGWLARARLDGDAVRISREVLDFLTGSGPLEGMWYGDRPAGAPMFWWRKYLPNPPKGG